jgi:hypothetical protein
MAKMRLKAQSAGSAAAFIALIAGFILLYMLLIPPDLRNELLGEGNTGTGTATQTTTTLQTMGIEKTVISESPGRIDYMKFSQYDHPLPSINLYSTTSSNEKFIGDSIYIKNGVFDRTDKNLSFDIPDPETVENVYLSFALNPNRNNNGRLMISLNDDIIYERDSVKTLDKPIDISKDLKKQNTLSFSVSGVAWKFWTTNDYELDNIKIVYDLKDTSAQMSKNTIMLTETEKFNLESAKLKFNPDCSPSQVGILTVTINNNLIFSAIPDCGQLNTVEMSPSFLEAGNNKIVFETEKGRYLIDSIVLHTQLKQMTYPVYYFDLDERLFNLYQEEDTDAKNCGDNDGVCPVNCPDYLDKDCCLQKTSKYWCDILPDNENNRCRGIVSTSDCSTCITGYEDKYGNPPEVCEDLCGDDTDNKCPAGCNKLYDKDCCFEESSYNYWCDDVPQYGLSNVCKIGIHEEDCATCASGYKTEDGTYTCPKTGALNKDEKAMLKTNYNIWLKMKFLNDGSRKAIKTYVNGYEFYIDTTADSYKRKINMYVEEGSNAIKIEPDRTTLEIIKMDVEIEEIR